MAKPAKAITFWSRVALAALLFSGAAQAAEKRLLIGSFDDVVIDGDMQIMIETGKSPSARATGDRNQLDLLKMDREGNTLRIRMASEPNQNRSKTPSEPLRIFITNRHVRDILLRGNGRLDVSAIKDEGPSQINLLGSGEIKIGVLNIDKLEANITGYGKLIIGSGMVRQSSVIIDGGANFDAPGLTSRLLDLTHRGNANSNTAVQESAVIDNSGSGSIRIGGPGACFIKNPGQATITCNKLSDKKSRN